MARKYTSDSSDDELLELDDFINTHVKNLNTLQAPKLNPTANRTLLIPSPTRTTIRQNFVIASPQKQLQATGLKSKPVNPRKPREKRVANPEPTPARTTAQRRPLAEKTSARSTNASRARATPHRKAKEVPKYEDVVDLTAESDEEISELEESIFCDSDGDGDGFETAQEDAEKTSLPLPRKLQLEPLHEDVLSQFGKLQLRTLTLDTQLSDSDDDLDSHIFNSRTPRKSPLKTYRSPRKIVDDSSSSESSDKENNSPVSQKVSYPKLSSTIERPSTPPPPTSPSKSKLVSPSKKKLRIPTPPHRPSLDAFWNPHAVNDWNDQYSPQKPLVSPKKDRFRPLEDTSDSPISSPRKSQSPCKRSRAVLDARKEFENRKHQLCEDFFMELDRRVTEGKIQELAASAGGVKFIWSKTLNSTAGRANWKRETRKTKHADGTSETTYCHYASIELAEKVIDDEERLLNVVAHEFCHLANFMVSGIKDQPHGRQFKIWGAKCTKAFGDRGVEVTTKHSYQIDYKYIWSCDNELCGQEYKRHSKSIDPARHACSICRGKLLQVKPVPRKPTGAAGPLGYAAFVKQNFAEIKKSMPGASHKEVMTAMGQRYREQKADAALKGEAAAKKSSSVEDVTKALEVVALD